MTRLCLVERGELQVLPAGGDTREREDTPIDVTELCMDVLERVAIDPDDNTRPVFVRIFDPDLVKTHWVLRVTWNWEFRVIHEDTCEFISYSERPDRSKWTRSPIGQNPEFLEMLRVTTAQFIPEVGELAVMVDMQSTVYLILVSPATEEPPPLPAKAEITEEQLNRLLTCVERGKHIPVGYYPFSIGGNVVVFGVCACGCLATHDLR